ncbi:hypothetical protein AK830_g10700 [Neonectria ditissima]|uniref:Uncharacterized protein n=1 Tax=Neonectria ditissima TaxID=78410 RepID=A0A0P7AF51_9HYPO|nr:hypothetical protein AK830_g10700 [Neonectria ditissima]
MRYHSKRRSEDISSCDDEERVDFPIRIRKSPRRNRVQSSPKETASTGNSKFDRKAFTEFLDNNLPIAFIKPEIKAALISDSNARLDEARRQEVGIDEIFIDEDCLPTWPGNYWDPSVESLNDTIQRHLNDLDRAKRLGDMVRSNVITKGNRRLEEACRLGVSLDSLCIGNGLLPVWDGYITIGLTLNHGDAGYEEASQNTNNFGMSTSSTYFGNASDYSTMATLVDSDTSRGFISSSPMAFDFSSSDSDSSSGNEDTVPNQEGNCLYSMGLDNAVHDQAYYSDDEDALNIVHDVEVAGASDGHPPVDLQVYIAHEDDEVYDLPEMEMTVNRDAFEDWHEMEEAIDIEVADTMMRCTGEIISIEDADGVDVEWISSANANTQMFFNPAPFNEDYDVTGGLDLLYI